MSSLGLCPTFISKFNAPRLCLVPTRPHGLKMIGSATSAVNSDPPVHSLQRENREPRPGFRLSLNKQYKSLFPGELTSEAGTLSASQGRGSSVCDYKVSYIAGLFFA